MDSQLQRLVQRLVFFSPFLYPAYFLRFKIVGIPFTALEVFIYLLFGLWLISLILKHKSVIWDKRTKWFSYAAFLLIVGAAIGIFTSPDFFNLPSGEILDAKQTALGVWKGWVFAPILYFAVLTQVLKTDKDIDRILRMFVYSAALVGLVSHGFALFADGITYDLRLSGFYESANYLALYLVPAIMISIYFYLKRTYPLKRIDYLDLSALVILVYCLFFTQSYAGIIGVFGAIGLFTLFYLIKSPKHRKKMGLALVVLGLTFAVVLLTQINSPKFKQALDWQNRSSTSVRLEIYQISWNMIRENPFTGIGPGLFQANYQTKAFSVLRRTPLEWNMPHAHNIFLGFWLNAGLIGLVAFILILILCHQKFTYPLVALWAILIHGLFDMPFWKNDLAMIFWLIIASILILQKLNYNKS